MLQYLPMISSRLIFRSALSVLMVSVFILQTQNLSAQSVLLSNLKSSEQTASSRLDQRSVLPKNNTNPDPLLNPRGPQSSPPRVSSILQTSGVDDALVSPKSTGAHEDLDAVLWLRTSVEFDALTRQAFAAATEKLGEALVDPNWDALVAAERTDAGSMGRPPCVIVDVDETMLDNSVFQMELIQSDAEYESTAWNEFVERRASPAIEGAVDFVQACRASGVKVFFVTNREATVEAATRDNLISQGLMTARDSEQILSKNERPDWTSDKTSRRRAVAQKYRVLLLIGDDLNDFLSAKNLTIDRREQLYLANQENFGRSWFVMPNPNYGSWEQATIGNDYRATQESKRELKMQTLDSTP